MPFEFATASRILFGAGVSDKAADLILEHGQHPMLVAGKTPARIDFLTRQFAARGVDTVYLGISSEPTVDDIIGAVARAQDAACDVIIGVGGGSAMDAAKAIAALLTNEGDPMDYLEVVGLGRPLQKRPVPCIAIPTTAGSGAEVTRNAVLTAPKDRVKVSLRHAWMLPLAAIVDPLLTHALPPEVTASTGLDAFTQLIEAFVSKQANPLTDALCRDGIQRASGALRTVYTDGTCAPAREDMALASLFGGLALANAKLGAVHGFAGVLGGLFPAPHGAVCARLLPLVLEANVHALQDREPQSPLLARHTKVARLITGESNAKAEDGIAWVTALCKDLRIPSLSSYGLESHHFEDVAEKSLRSSSMRGNPIELTNGELIHILEQACND